MVRVQTGDQNVVLIDAETWEDLAHDELRLRDVIFTV